MYGKSLMCDAPGCDHREDIDVFSEDLIGKPCPKCGANLLTKDDYDAALPVYAAMDMLEKAGFVKGATVDTSGEKAQISFNIHDGAAHIKITGV